MLKYTDETKQFVHISNHIFETESDTIEVTNQIVPINHRLWFEYRMDKLVETGEIEEYQELVVTFDQQIAQVDATRAELYRTQVDPLELEARRLERQGATPEELQIIYDRIDSLTEKIKADNPWPTL